MDLVTLAAANAYTKKSISGAGSIAGAPCQIQSITPIEGGQRVTFLWKDNDGTTHTDPMDVMNGTDGTNGLNGVDGKSIQTAVINAQNHLIITLDDNPATVIDAGEVATNAFLNNSLTSTVSVGGIASGKIYAAKTSLETIFNDMLSPDNKIGLCNSHSSFNWGSSGEILNTFDFDANALCGRTNYEGQPSFYSSDGVSYYPIKISNNVQTVIITPAVNTLITVNAAYVYNGNVYKKISEVNYNWEGVAVSINAETIRSNNNLDDFYIIAMVAKSDWGLITDTEPLKPTIQYTSSISPNLPPFPTSEGNYTLKCTVNSSGNAMLSWIAMS